MVSIAFLCAVTYGTDIRVSPLYSAKQLPSEISKCFSNRDKKCYPQVRNKQIELLDVIQARRRTGTKPVSQVHAHVSLSYIQIGKITFSPLAAGGCLVGLPRQNYSLPGCIHRYQYLFYWYRGPQFRVHTWPTRKDPKSRAGSNHSSESIAWLGLASFSVTRTKGTAQS